MKWWQWVLASLVAAVIWDRLSPTLGPGGLFVRARRGGIPDENGQAEAELWWRFPEVLPDSPVYLRTLRGLFTRAA